jgi:hypothetical protein
VARLPSPGDAAAVLLAVVSQSAAGWDHVTAGLVQLAVILLDTPSLRAPVPTTAAADHGSPYALGAELLHAVYVRHEAARGEVLEQVLARVVARADAAPRFVDALARCVTARGGR